MTDLFAELDRERSALLDTIAGLDEATLDRKGVVDEWSIKNVLAHLVGWEIWVIQALPALLASGEMPEALRAAAADEDGWNAAQVAEREELTPGEQLIELERTRAALLEYLHTLDEATLTRPHPWPRWRGTLMEYLFFATRDHEARHRKEIQVAIDRL